MHFYPQRGDEGERETTIMMVELKGVSSVSYTHLYEFVEPQGAFYLWVRALEDDAQAFSNRAKVHELLLVPSDSFGVPSWVRISYCVSPEVIKRSLPAFKALMEEYRG